MLEALLRQYSLELTCSCRAARGNTSLESAVALTKDLRWEIQSLGARLARAVAEEGQEQSLNSTLKQRSASTDRLASIILDIKRLLGRIEDAVPLINLAITTSGIKLSTTLPATVSPSRLLQASTFISAADTQYALSSASTVQVGPTFTLSLYMLFSGHSHRRHDADKVRETTWKEAIHKARVKLLRVPLERVQAQAQFAEGDNQPSQPAYYELGYQSISADGKAYEFAYQLLLVEDLDDDRVHSYEDDEPQPGPYDDVQLAGVREIIPIHQISKIFYADTGKILNIGTEGETNNPVLLLKRDINASPPRRMMDEAARNETAYSDYPGYEEEEGEGVGNNVNEEQSEIDAQLRRDSTAGGLMEPSSVDEDPQHHPWRLPPTLDPEWVAFEVYSEEPDSETEDEDFSDDLKPTTRANTPLGPYNSSEPNITPAFANLSLRQASISPSDNSQRSSSKQLQASLSRPQSNGLPNIKTSLSLLEMLIRLTSLQQFQQASHLSITDELLTFFLEESSTTGAGADTDMRQRVRRDARRRVGFDPYDESPIKRRGEDYLYRYADHGYAYDENGYNSRAGYSSGAIPSPAYYNNYQPEIRSSPGPMIQAYPYHSPSPRDTTPGPISGAGRLHVRPQSQLHKSHNVDSPNGSEVTDYGTPHLRQSTSPAPELLLSSPPTPMPLRKLPSLQKDGQSASSPTTPSRMRARPAALRDEATGRRTRSSPLGLSGVVQSVEEGDAAIANGRSMHGGDGHGNGNGTDERIERNDRPKGRHLKGTDSALGTSPGSEKLPPVIVKKKEGS